MAERFGIRRDRAVNYNCDSVGTAVNYKALSNVRKCVGAECMEDALCEWDKIIHLCELVETVFWDFEK